jgi:K+-sensing histidine kinase KdpD
MKIFIYKTVIVAVVTLILFEIIIGSKIKSIKREISQISSEQNREKIITKIREEISKANNKDNYLNEEDRKLLSTFLKKIGKELDLKN